MTRLLSSRPFSSRRLLRGGPGLQFVFILPVLLLAACYVPSQAGYLPPADTSIQADKEPPTPRDEPIPPAPAGPADSFAWNAGHWHWTGTEYVWIPGQYIERPYSHGVWARGGWHYDGDQHWTWTPGHWE